MKWDVITIFPGMFNGALSESILQKAQDRSLISIAVHDLREFSTDTHYTVDDEPFGGGAGMVFKPEPIFRAVQHLKRRESTVLLLSPQGEPFSQPIAHQLSRERHIILLCMRYKGVDERIRELVVNREISLGDYVLSGGELPAMVVIDAVSRLLPGVVGDPASVGSDSFQNGLLDHPQYTRPAVFEGLTVPDILRSGNHEEIGRWKRRMALENTHRRRPDLLASYVPPDAEMKALLREIQEETNHSREGRS